MSTVVEIEAALKELPLNDAKKIARWLESYLNQQNHEETPKAGETRIKLPDYAARRRTIFGDKTLPNMVLLGRQEERW